MANFKEVNKAVKVAFPSLDIEVVRGQGYVYYCGADGFDKINSLYAHPTSTTTASMIRMVLADILEVYPNGKA